MIKNSSSNEKLFDRLYIFWNIISVRIKELLFKIGYLEVEIVKMGICVNVIK